MAGASSDSAASRAATPGLTAIVCTQNRAALLDLCLQSLLRQTLPRDQYAVLVVDNASTDDTPAVCARYAGQGVRYVREPVPGLSQARNTGWRHAAPGIVGYLDDDATAAPGWLAAARDAFTMSPAPAWVGGPIELAWTAPAPDWLDVTLQESLGRLDWGNTPRWLDKGERLGGGNSFFPRARLEQAGGFDTRLGRRNQLLLSGEETQLQRRLEAQAGRLYYHPGVRIHHYVPVERLRPAFFYRRYFWGGVTDAVIRRTLRERLAGAAGTALPTAMSQGGTRPRDTVRRALRHAAAAAGLAARDKRIHGRIYLAYVLGVCRGRLLRLPHAPL